MKYFTGYFAKLTLGIMLVCFSALYLFTACDRDADDILSETGNLTIETSVEGYLPADGTTRAAVSVDGITTTFEVGDEIGVFALKGNSLLYNNLKLTYAGSGKWNSSSIIYNYGSDVAYYAYSPYSADMNGKKSTDEIKNAFTIKDNQVYPADFKASNLLIANTTLGSAATTTLNFNFAPAFSLIIIPKQTKMQGVSKIPNSTDYTYDFYHNQGAILEKSYISNDSYNMIVKPGAFTKTIIAVAGAVTYNISTSVSAGQYKKIILNSKVNRDLRVGDFVCVYNGNLSFMPGNYSHTWVDIKNVCIGIVCSVGKGALYGDEAHGIVLAATDFASNITYYEARDGAAGYSKPSPPGGSGWFLPSFRMLQYIFSGSWGVAGDAFGRKLEKYLTPIPGTGFNFGQTSWYWSSETPTSSTYYGTKVTNEGKASIQKASFKSSYLHGRAIAKF